MLNKEMTQTAEQIAQEMRPVFRALYKLGKEYDNSRQNMAKARSDARSWTHTAAALDWDYTGHQGIPQEERERARKTKAENPKQWAAIYDEKWQAAATAEDLFQVARVNFVNYMNYAARYLGDLIRPHWRDLIDRRGILTLADIINKANKTKKDHSAGAVSCGVYLDDCETDSTDRRKVGQWARISVAIYSGWACGEQGNATRYYQTNPDEVWHYAEKPHKMSLQQYQTNAAKIARKLKELEEQRDALYEFARSCGLLGFVYIAAHIQKTK